MRDETAICVLIVEDDPDSRELLVELLQSELPDARVLSAPHAEEALRLAARHSPEVVVTDLTLPGMDGIALCRALKGAGPDAPAVVLVTGHGEVEGAECFDAVITKPLDISDLSTAVRLLTGRGREDTSPAGPA